MLCRDCQLLTGVILILLLAALVVGCGRGNADGVKSVVKPPSKPIALWVFVDVSGSVFQVETKNNSGQPRIETMASLLEQVVDDLGGVYDEFAVFQFFHTVDLITRKRPSDALEVFQVSDDLRAATKKDPRLKNLRGTFIVPVLEKIKDEVKLAEGKEIFVLILTDGAFDDSGIAKEAVASVAEAKNIKSIFVGPVLVRDRIRSINEDIFKPLRENDRVIVTGQDDIQDNLEKWEAMINAVEKK